MKSNLLKTIANGTKIERQKAIEVLNFGGNDSPILKLPNGEILASCARKSGQVQPLCIIDDL